MKITDTPEYRQRMGFLIDALDYLASATRGARDSFEEILEWDADDAEKMADTEKEATEIAKEVRRMLSYLDDSVQHIKFMSQYKE